LEGMASFILLLSLRWIGETDPSPGNSPCQAGSPNLVLNG